MLSIILNLGPPRLLLVVAVMVAAVSVSIRHASIIFLLQSGVSRRRSNLYGNLMAVAAAVFAGPWSMSYVVSAQS